MPVANIIAVDFIYNDPANADLAVGYGFASEESALPFLHASSRAVKRDAPNVKRQTFNIVTTNGGPVMYSEAVAEALQLFLYGNGWDNGQRYELFADATPPLRYEIEAVRYVMEGSMAEPRVNLEGSISPISHNRDGSISINAPGRIALCASNSKNLG